MRRDDLGPRREPRRPVLRWRSAAGREEEHALSLVRPATIGRDPDCTIALDSRMVSKAHALVEFRDGEFTIQDLESANGTRVNGEPTAVRVLEPGDRIEVGDVELTFMDAAVDDAAAAGPVAVSAGSKAVRLGLTAALTLIVMLGLLFMLIGGPGGSKVASAKPEEKLAPASPELLARLRAASADSPVVKDVVQYATVAGTPPAKALYEEGRLRLEAQRWRDAAMLLAATVTRDAANTVALSAFTDAAAHLDRAASKALAAAESADYGMRYDDALLHADEVLQLVDQQDPRYGRALKITEHARSQRPR
ncbi:MAG: hypothetical protein RLZZ53_43 [Acidobacteriota bacterium]